MHDFPSPQHRGAQKFLRIGGAVILALGGVLELVGFGGFFASVVSHSGLRAQFVCQSIGLSLMWLGGVMCLFGFLGAITRYVAAEQAPVAKDALNYLAEGTQEAVHTVARSAAQGVTEGVARRRAAGGDPK